MVTKEFVENVDPAAIILSNTNPNDIEGETPRAWLTGNYSVFYVHHSAVRPWLPNAKADIFVSEYLAGKYNNLKDRMQKLIIAPTGIKSAPFQLHKPKWSKRKKKSVVIGRLTNDNAQKYPAELLTILNEVGCKYEIVGGEKYYGPASGLYTPLPIGSMSPLEFLKRWDIFVYKSSIPETWGRAVVEAMAAGLPVVADNQGGITENIIHGETGFLCSSDAEFVEYLKVLSDDPRLRKKIGQAAREYALENFSENPFKKLVEPLLVKAALQS
jgi:glycosyltransferase involved in cell wall biosynthesis